VQESEQLNRLEQPKSKMEKETQLGKEKTEIEAKKEKEGIVVKPLPVEKEKANVKESGLERKVQDKPSEAKKEEKTEEEKKDKPKKKEEVKPISKKEEAVANGRNFPVSKKQCMYICSFIKYKPIDSAMTDLTKVINMKKAVPFKGEIPHRKGMSTPGRYPVKAAGYFINLLKGLKGNVIVNGMDLDKTRISLASATWANRPMRAQGKAAKRTNVILKAKEFDTKTKQGGKEIE
jgi:ribosomal protein L22